MGWGNVFSSEIDNYCNKITKQHFPNCIQHGDIRTTDFTIYKGRIDIITGGDPCQGNSVIGKMEGENYEGFLWPEMFRCIVEATPWFVVNENVGGSISNGILDRKISDLDHIGYTCWPPLVIPANFVGASHTRKRVWLVAHRTEGRLERRDGISKERHREAKIRPIQTLVDYKDGAICVKPEFLRNYDGVSHRVDRIKGLGNAIVPQVAYEIFKAIEQYK